MVAVSFLVGLFHSLQPAGLTRRSLINAAAQTGQMESSQKLMSGNANQVEFVGEKGKCAAEGNSAAHWAIRSGLEAVRAQCRTGCDNKERCV
jgi:hypothetical protein